MCYVIICDAGRTTKANEEKKHILKILDQTMHKHISQNPYLALFSSYICLPSNNHTHLKLQFKQNKIAVAFDFSLDYCLRDVWTIAFADGVVHRQRMSSLCRRPDSWLSLWLRRQRRWAVMRSLPKQNKKKSHTKIQLYNQHIKIFAVVP